MIHEGVKVGEKSLSAGDPHRKVLVIIPEATEVPRTDEIHEARHCPLLE